ncbi:hypothetical protein [Methyloceanibacter superfactus]|jgi:hypothetical protein|nr:hypothetical protein [Methyloceanibacter superfactus]
MGRQLVRLAASLMVTFGAGVLDAAAEPLPVAPPSQSLVQPVWGFNGSCDPIDFDSVKIEYRRDRGYQLTITGIKPYTNMEVSLNSEPYDRKPAYLRTVVVGCVKNFIVVPLETPYYLTVPLAPLMGTKGVEIVGASGSVRRNAPRR